MHSHSHHDHSHGQGHFPGAAERALWVALWLNFGFLIVEVIVGLWSNSLALLSDAGHMVSDVASLGFALVAERLSRARPNGSYTFGLKRVPILGAFGNALTLLAIVGIIYWEAFKRFRNPAPVAGYAVLIAGALGLIVNVVSAWWLHRSSESSLNVRGALLHLIADALGSVGALISAVVILTTGWMLVDPLVSIFIGTLILLSTWPLLRDSVKVLLQAAPTHIDISELQEFLCSAPEVKTMEDFHLWELNTGDLILSTILITEHNDLTRLEQTSDKLRTHIQDKYNIQHATFEWRTTPHHCQEDRPVVRH